MVADRGRADPLPAGIAAVFSRRAAKTVLPVASLLVIANGVQGTYLHLRGIRVEPGGLRNFRYNMEMGPPAFAPAPGAPGRRDGLLGLAAAPRRRLSAVPNASRPERSPRADRVVSLVSMSSTRSTAGTTSPPGSCWPAWTPA